MSRALLFPSYALLWFGSAAVVALGRGTPGAPGLLGTLLGIAILLGLWRGRAWAWCLAVVVDAGMIALLLALLAVPWGAAPTALVGLGALRLVVLCQPAMRPRPTMRSTEPRTSAR